MIFAFEICSFPLSSILSFCSLNGMPLCVCACHPTWLRDCTHVVRMFLTASINDDISNIRCVFGFGWVFGCMYFPGCVCTYRSIIFFRLFFFFFLFYSLYTYLYTYMDFFLSHGYVNNKCFAMACILAPKLKPLNSTIRYMWCCVKKGGFLAAYHSYMVHDVIPYHERPSFSILSFSCSFGIHIYESDESLNDTKIKETKKYSRMHNWTTQNVSCIL